MQVKTKYKNEKPRYKDVSPAYGSSLIIQKTDKKEVSPSKFSNRAIKKGMKKVTNSREIVIMQRFSGKND